LKLKPKFTDKRY